MLFCPGKTSRPPPTRFAGFDFQQVDYEIVSPGIKDNEPDKVFARCPFHGHVALVDGSVIQGKAK